MQNCRAGCLLKKLSATINIINYRLLRRMNFCVCVYFGLANIFVQHFDIIHHIICGSSPGLMLQTYFSGQTL